MAVPLTPRLTSLKNQISKTPQLILEVEGIDDNFSTTVALDLSRWDASNIFWDDGKTFWDGLSQREGNQPLIDLKGSQRSLSQQIRPDKSSTQSVPTFNLTIVDKNNIVAQQFSFDNIGEQLGKKCNVFLALEGSTPEDYIPILFGFIDEFTFKAGKVKLSISHASNLQRQGIYSQATTELSSSINDSTTTILVDSTQGFIEASDSQKTFLQIEDEIMQVVSSSPTSFTVNRGQLGTQAVAHNQTEVLSYYTLTGKPIDLALKIMLSDENNTFRSIGYNLDAIEYVSVSESINNALIFDSFDIQELSGLVVNDTVRISGSSSNDGDYTIAGFGKTNDNRSFILTQQDLAQEASSSATVEYKSQFNVLKEGLGLEAREVDVAGMTDIAASFDSEYFEYQDLKIDQSIDNAKEFIEKELFFPQNTYSIPRKARISARYTVSPLSIEIVPTLNEKNVKNIQLLSPQRSIHKYYYNTIQYRYNVSYLDSKFFRTKSFVSGPSSRIATGKSLLPIPSNGIRETASTDTDLDRLSKRLLTRYQLAALEIKGIEVLFKDSLNIEVGDIIPFGGTGTQLPNPETGKRDLPVKLYEVVNKSLDIQSGRVKLDILETNFGTRGVRAVVSPTSGIDSRSTTSEIIVKKIIDTEQFFSEREKYEQYLGAAVRVHSEDYTYDESSFIVGFSASNDQGILIDPALPSLPPAGSRFEVDVYTNQPLNEAGDLIKIKYCFTMVQEEITAVASNQEFDVNDASRLFIGQEITVHSPDFTSDSFSETVKIDNIAGQTITLESSLPFVPSIGFFVETYTLQDGNDGYVVL